jgi:TRAP-type C4-dicarboxylate transport system permease small subunit
MVDTIHALKIEWIDVILRQLVVIVGFLGAMLATRRRKHINIDALSRLLPEQARRVVAVMTNLLSVVICFFLGSAGIKLVQMSREFPTELTEWADEWSFQLMFPLGFFLLALHFAIRTMEASIALRDRLPVEAGGGLEGGAATVPAQSDDPEDTPPPGGPPEIAERPPSAKAKGARKRRNKKKKGGRR